MDWEAVSYKPLALAQWQSNIDYWLMCGLDLGKQSAHLEQSPNNTEEDTIGSGKNKSMLDIGQQTNGVKGGRANKQEKHLDHLLHQTVLVWKLMDVHNE